MRVGEIHKLNEAVKIKTTVFILLALLNVQGVYAQGDSFERSVRKIKQHIFSGDTVLYNQEKISFFDISKNGNIQIATREGTDTLQFNLMLLHPLQIDSANGYNRYGMGLYGRSLDLFIEETRNSLEYNEKDELVMTRVILPVFELKFEDRYQAKAAADLLVQLRESCKLDNKAFIRVQR